MTKAEAERLSTCAKQLEVSKTEVLMKGLALVENECQKQAQLQTSNQQYGTLELGKHNDLDIAERYKI